MSAPYEFPANSDLSSLGIYNVLDTGYAGGMSTADMTGMQNKQALQAAINAALGARGGLVFIPSGTYKIAGTIMIEPTTDVGIIIAGSSEATELVQQNAVATFSASYTTGSNTAGIRFQDLLIQYISGLKSGTAISVSNFQNVSCEHVFFSDCPQAASYSNTLQCGLFNCTVDYEGSVPNLTMVSIQGGSAETYINNCELRQKPQGNQGPAGCIGVEILGASAVYVTNSHISDFNIGVKIQGGGPNFLHGHFSNVVSQSWQSSVYIQPATSGGTIQQLFFDNCTFALENGSVAVNPTGVYIDTNGGPNANVSDILFSNCMCYQWGGAGIQINSGQNIQIIGGRYGSCASSVPTSGGIAITGAAANVSVVGADCSGTVPEPTGQYAQQPYGISVTAAVAGAYIRGCDLTGNKTGPVYTTSAVTQLEITNCAGYNDQNTPLNGGHAPPTATSAETSSAPYFGPSTVTFSNASPLIVHISGTPYPMSFGSIYLPNPTDKIFFSAAPSTFTWLGK